MKMRCLACVACGLVLAGLAAPASAEFEFSGDGWYAFLWYFETQSHSDETLVGGPFSDKDACLSFLGSHYAKQLTVPEGEDAEPEAEGECSHYTDANQEPDATAGFDPGGPSSSE